MMSFGGSRLVVELYVGVSDFLIVLKEGYW